VTSERPADVANALRVLRTGRTDERLSAARLLQNRATVAELRELARASRRELDHYVRVAIDEAAEAAAGRDITHVVGDVDPEADATTPAGALASVTASLVHELRPVLGLARLSAGKGDMEATLRRLDQLHRILDVFESVARAEGEDRHEAFDLATLIQAVADDIASVTGVSVEVVDNASLKVFGSRGAIELVVRNAITNACESMLATDPVSRVAVSVSYGRTDRAAWVAVVDDGLGLEVDIDFFEAGSSTKEGHDGVGLAIARRAIGAVGGAVVLTAREPRGAQLYASWPQDPG
jgi:signal transduction histidine kinase